MSDIEQILRRELDDVAGHVRTRRVPVGELVAAGRSVRRRRRAVGATLSAAVLVAVLALTTSVTGMLSSAPPPPAHTPDPVVRSSSPGPTPGPSRAAAAWLERWYGALAQGRPSPLPPHEATQEGRASWRGRNVRLPRGPGTPAGTVTLTHTATPRGLLVSWHGEYTGAEDWEQQLGWITPRGRWVRVDTGELADLVFSPDGRSYAYTVQSFPGRPFVVTVRDIRTDAVSGRYTFPTDDGWMHGWNRAGLILTLPGTASPDTSDTYSWTPGRERPTLLAKGWTARDVVRGTRILAGTDAETCAYAVLDAARPGAPTVKGCGRASLSPDGRYLVDGLVITDLDEGGVTSLAPGMPSGPEEPLDPQALVDAAMAPEVRWLGDRTFETHIDLSRDDAGGGVRCTVPTGPCLRVAGGTRSTGPGEGLGVP